MLGGHVDREKMSSRIETATSVLTHFLGRLNPNKVTNEDKNGKYCFQKRELHLPQGRALFDLMHNS